MNLSLLEERLKEKNIFHSKTTLINHPAVVGYDKRFRWRWIATQLNTFVFAVDFGANPIGISDMEACLTEAFEFSKKNYKGWPRGLQSGLGAIVIALSNQLSEEVITFCREMNAGKKYAGFAIPACVNSGTGEVHYFEKYPLWGRIYYPFFDEMLKDLTRSADS
jgi:hypothetical protein